MSALLRPNSEVGTHEMVASEPPSYDGAMATPGGQLESKVVLVSGGASDIGRATALRLAAAGAVVVVGVR
jgi:hypothetical protein